MRTAARVAGAIAPYVPGVGSAVALIAKSVETLASIDLGSDDYLRQHPDIVRGIRVRVTGTPVTLRMYIGAYSNLGTITDEHLREYMTCTDCTTLSYSASLHYVPPPFNTLDTFVAPGTVIWSSAINAFMVATAARLTELAVLYSQYRYKHSSIHWKGFASDFADGGVAGFIIKDPGVQLTTTNPATVVQLVHEYGGPDCKVNAELDLPIPPAPRVLNIVDDPMTDPRFVNQGNAYIIAFTPIDTKYLLGEVSLHYELEAHAPANQGASPVGCVSCPTSFWYLSTAPTYGIATTTQYQSASFVLGQEIGLPGVSSQSVNVASGAWSGPRTGAYFPPGYYDFSGIASYTFGPAYQFTASPFANCNYVVSASLLFVEAANGSEIYLATSTNQITVPTVTAGTPGYYVQNWSGQLVFNQSITSMVPFVAIPVFTTAGTNTTPFLWSTTVTSVVEWEGINLTVQCSQVYNGADNVNTATFHRYITDSGGVSSHRRTKGFTSAPAKFVLPKPVLSPMDELAAQVESLKSRMKAMADMVYDGARNPDIVGLEPHVIDGKFPTLADEYQELARPGKLPVQLVAKLPSGYLRDRKSVV